jgi:hypothetical protein
MASKNSNNRGNSNGRAGAADVARAAARALAELTGRRPETVHGIRKDDDGWKVMVEVLELSRVPNSTDVLASYLVAVDEDGELLGYERVHRYLRGQTGGGD